MKKQQIEKEIKNITQQLIEKYQPEKIILFGSMARGEFNGDSDLDFLIIKSDVPASGIERRWEVRKLVKKTLPADFLVYHPEEIKNRFQRREPFILTILKEGKVLYAK